MKISKSLPTLFGPQAAPDSRPTTRPSFTSINLPSEHRSPKPRANDIQITLALLRCAGGCSISLLDSLSPNFYYFPDCKSSNDLPNRSSLQQSKTPPPQRSQSLRTSSGGTHSQPLPELHFRELLVPASNCATQPPRNSGCVQTYSRRADL